MINPFSEQDLHYMQQAIALAELGRYGTSPNPRVGCVLVKQGKIIGQGYHLKAGTGHAEVNALAQAGDQAKGAMAYVTLEPCSHYGRTPPCAKALIDAGVCEVVVAMMDPNPLVAGSGLAMLQQAGIKTRVGLLAAQAHELNVGFIKLMQTGMPYLRCKLASSLDGKTAMASGESQWITSAEARADVQRLRAQSCAIISGADTVITDNARLNVRAEQLANAEQYFPASHFPDHAIRQPVRVIIDSQHRLSPDLALFTIDSPILLVSTQLAQGKQWPDFVEQLLVAADPLTGKVNLASLLAQLGQRGFNDILLEAGAQLAGAFFAQNLVDQLVLYQAPKLLGSDAKNLMQLPNIERLEQAKQLEYTDMSLVGADLRIIANCVNKKTRT